MYTVTYLDWSPDAIEAGMPDREGSAGVYPTLRDALDAARDLAAPDAEGHGIWRLAGRGAATTETLDPESGVRTETLIHWPLRHARHAVRIARALTTATRTTLHARRTPWHPRD